MLKKFLITLSLLLLAGQVFAAQNQVQSVFGGGYNPAKIDAARAVVGTEKSNIHSSFMNGYILAYLDLDYENWHTHHEKIDYCPPPHIPEVVKSISEYILSKKDAVNIPFTTLIPEALREKFPCP